MQLQAERKKWFGIKKIKNKKMNPIITNNLSQIKDLCQKHHVKELYVFGSVTTDKFRDDSDVDFSYIMDEVPLEKSADNFFDLLWKLEDVFNRKVDLVNEKYLDNKYFIRELNEKKQLLYHG